MKKTLIVLLISLVFLGSLFVGCTNNSNKNDSPNNVQIKYSQGLEFVEYEDSCELIGMGNCTDADIYIPDIYNGKSVTSIGDGAFKYCPWVKTVTLPDTIKTFNIFSLESFSIVEIYLPDSMEEVNLSNFIYCHSLEKIVLGKSVKNVYGDNIISNINFISNIKYNEYNNGLYLGTKNNPYFALIGINNFDSKEFFMHNDTKLIASNAFYSSEGHSSTIESIHISNSVEYIGARAFAFCTGIKSINIPSSVKYIDSLAFVGCTALENITLPNDLEYLGISESKYLPNIKYNEYENGLYLGNSDNPYLALIRVKDSKISSFKIHNDTKIISEHAFYFCEELTDVDIPNSVKTICRFAFVNCTSLKSATIPDSVEYLYQHTFSQCLMLSKIVLPNSIKVVENSFISKLVAPGVYPIPYIDVYYNGSINEWLEIEFNSIGGVENLYINNELVTDLVIPEGVKRIGDFSFAGFKGIKSVTIPNTVTDIGRSAFSGCDLEKVDMPNSVAHIRDGAFAYCSKLKTINIPASVTQLASKVFYGCDSLIDIVIPEGVTTIENEAFYGCDALTSVTIPQSIVSISDNAFDDCISLEYTVENNTYYLGNDNNPYLYLVKCNDTAITEFKISDTTKVVNSLAFSECDLLVEINIPEKVTNIDFLGYQNLSIMDSDRKLKVTEVSPNNQHYVIIDGNLFSKDGRTLVRYYGKEGEESFEVPNTVTNIARAAFSFNYQIKNIIVPDSVKAIDYGAFYACTNLESILLPNDIKVIEYDTFSYCVALKNVIIPDSVLEIGSSAFLNCYMLENIIIPDSVLSINNYAFTGCKSLKSVAFGKSSVQVYMSAFSNCKVLEKITISLGTQIKFHNEAFSNCNISQIDFDGTIEEWKIVSEKIIAVNAISTDYTVYCTDGTITRSGIESYY